MYKISMNFHGKVFIPYCYGNHWCLIMLKVDDHTIQHFDPLGLDRGNRAITAFVSFLHDCDPAFKNNLCKIK